MSGGYAASIPQLPNVVFVWVATSERTARIQPRSLSAEQASGVLLVCGERSHHDLLTLCQGHR